MGSLRPLHSSALRPPSSPLLAPVRRIAPSLASRRLLVECSRGSTPYEPLERAIQVLNRVITVGERSGWGAGTAGGSSAGGGKADRPPLPERWVQFGAASSAQLAVDEAAGSSSGSSSSVPEAGLSASADGATTATSGSSATATTTTTTTSSSSGNGGSSENSRVGASAPCSSSEGRTLEDYLALPVDQYSLLDPKWITRLGGGCFKLTVPLAEVLGVDLTPEIQVQVHTDERSGTVTLVGSRAALGSPQVDAAFRLHLVAVLSQRGGAQQRQWGQRWPQRGLADGTQQAQQGEGEWPDSSAGSGGSGGGGPLSRLRQLRLRRPSHIPGRPVTRLRKLVARARGKQWSLASDEWEGPDAAQLAAQRMGSWSEEEWEAAPPAAAAAGTAAAAAAAGSTAGQAGSSGRRGSSGDDCGSGASAAGQQSEVQQPPAQQSGAPGSSGSAPEGEEPWPVARGQRLYITADESDEDFYGAELQLQPRKRPKEQHSAGSSRRSSSTTNSGGSSSSSSSEAVGAVTGRALEAEQAGPLEAARLACRVNVKVALRVPQPIRAVPNALLGYAGSMLLRAVLTAALPNFLDLLATDYKRWASGARSDIDASVGGLFDDPAALEPHEAVA